LLPLGQRVDEQAGLVGIDGDDQLALADFDQSLPIARGKNYSPLRVQRQIGNPSKFLHA
jgi:hypothetical protein